MERPYQHGMMHRYKQCQNVELTKTMEGIEAWEAEGPPPPVGIFRSISGTGSSPIKLGLGTYSCGPRKPKNEMHFRYPLPQMGFRPSSLH